MRIALLRQQQQFIIDTTKKQQEAPPVHPIGLLYWWNNIGAADVLCRSACLRGGSLAFAPWASLYYNRIFCNNPWSNLRKHGKFMAFPQI
jgi:hypothetical protein